MAEKKHRIHFIKLNLYKIFCYIIYINTMHNSSFQSTKNRTPYQFVGKKEDLVEPVDELRYFYQVCSFANPKSGKYHMRKYVVNSKNEFLDISVYQLTSKQYKKFLSTKQKHEYKSYDTYDLRNVNHPTLTDLHMMKSDILSNTYDYTGYAPF